MHTTTRVCSYMLSARRHYLFFIITALIISVSAHSQETVPNNICWPVSQLPAPADIAMLCQTDSGRLQVIQNLDTNRRYDMWAQWMGAKMNNIPTQATFDEYLVAHIKEICGGGPGWAFSMDPQYATYYWTGGPNPPTIECFSANEGGDTTDDCHMHGPLLLPAGWQVCKLMYDKYTRRHGKLSITPAFWNEYDNSEFPRFRGYNVSITGHGDVGNSSGVRLTNVRIFAIKASLDNNERIRCGCEMPRKPPPVIQAPPPTPPSAQPANLTYKIANIRKDRCDFVVTNTGGKRGTAYYEISYTKDGINWALKETGTISIDPGSINSDEKLHWDAINWRVDRWVILPCCDQ